MRHDLRTAYGGAVGQQRESAWNVDWPRIDPLANYTRTMNWEARTMTEEFDRKPGLNPASWKYGVAGSTVRSSRTCTRPSSSPAATPGTWTDPSAAGRRPPDLAEIDQLDMWLNPHGFLKAARDARARTRRPRGDGSSARWDATARGQAGEDEVVSITVDGKYRVDATINHAEHAPADPHLGGRPGAGRHELRARVHQRQLRRHRQRNQVSRPAGTRIRAGTTTTARRT